MTLIDYDMFQPDGYPGRGEMVSEKITMNEIMTIPLDLFFSSDQVPDIKRMARCLDVEDSTKRSNS